MVGRSGATRADLARIFDGGSAAGLGDGELLGRFADRGDAAAFEALVGRLGPMVLGVCRRSLADPADVDDAFQATFLVLARRAGSIRDRELVGAWLHGVAARVARRARGDSARRLARERSAAVPEAREDPEPGGPELRALIDEEIGRLPEHHRRPVVLCDVEGLGREEAARRLGWTPNMVRGRLERARDRLRARLARRGVAPSGAWMASLLAPPTPPLALLAATSRAALASAAGRIGPGLATASAVALSRGVLRMTMLSNLKAAAAAAISAGLVAGSGALATQGPGEPARLPAPKAVAPPAPPGGEGASGGLAALGRSRIEMARKRLATQQASYDEGRITIDRILGASQSLMEAELDVSETAGSRTAAVRSHLDRIREIERRERAELAIGRATAADVEEIQTHRLDVEFRLAKEAAAAGPPRGAANGVARGTPGMEGPGGSPLRDSIAMFNERSEGREVGRDQPPLTEDEVVAAVRFWDRPEGSPVSDALLARFRAIAQDRRLPPGAEWDVETGMDRGGDALFEGWWVRIRLPKEDGGSYAFPIRERVLRVVPLEEALRKNEEGLRRLSGQVSSGRSRMEEAIRDLGARIGRRDGAARP